MKILLFSILFFTIHEGALAKECSLSEVYKSCEGLKTAGLVVRKTPDGSVVPNIPKAMYATPEDFKDPAFVKVYDQLGAPPKNIEEGDKKIEKTFNFVREAYIAEILQGKKENDPSFLNQIRKGKEENDPSLDAASRSMIARLRTLKILRVDGGFFCDDKIMNAAYLPGVHTIVVCNGLAKAPPEMFLFIVSHEVGHSIDTCRVSSPLLKIKADIAHKTCDQSVTPYESPFYLSEHAGELIVPNEVEFHAEVLKKCGYAEVLVPAESNMGPNIIAKTATCVLKESQKNDNFSSQALDRFQSELKTQIKNSDPEQSDSSIKAIFEKVDPEIKKSYKEYSDKMSEVSTFSSGCSDGKVNVTVAERSADTMAARIVKKYLSSHNLTEEQKRNLIEFQSQVACAYKDSGGKKFDNPMYPLGDERLNILFQEPEFQKAFNCTYSGAEICSSRQVESPLAAKSENNSLKGQK